MKKALVITGVLTCVVIITTLKITASHWWKGCNYATVTRDGKTESDADVYCSPEGSILVYLKQGGLYVIHPKTREIGMVNRSHFFMLFGYAYSRNVPPLLAPMEKAEVDPKLIVEENQIEFNSIDNKRIRVTWLGNG